MLVNMTENQSETLTEIKKFWYSLF